MLISKAEELYNKMTDSLGTPIEDGDYALLYGTTTEYNATFVALYVVSLEIGYRCIDFKDLLVDYKVLKYDHNYIFKISKEEKEIVCARQRRYKGEHDLLNMLEDRRVTKGCTFKLDWLERDLSCGDLVMYIADDCKCHTGILVGDNKIFNDEFKVIKVKYAFKLSCVGKYGLSIQNKLKQLYLNRSKKLKNLKKSLKHGDVFICSQGCVMYIEDNMWCTLADCPSVYSIDAILDRDYVYTDMRYQLGYYDLSTQEINGSAWFIKHLEISGA